MKWIIQIHSYLQSQQPILSHYVESHQIQLVQIAHISQSCNLCALLLHRVGTWLCLNQHTPDIWCLFGTILWSFICCFFHFVPMLCSHRAVLGNMVVQCHPIQYQMDTVSLPSQNPDCGHYRNIFQWNVLNHILLSADCVADTPVHHTQILLYHLDYNLVLNVGRVVTTYLYAIIVGIVYFFFPSASVYNGTTSTLPLPKWYIATALYVVPIWFYEK